MRKRFRKGSEMRQRQTINFVEHRPVTDWVPLLDAVKFKPKGRAQWLQRMAWRFLGWRQALEQAYEPKVTTTRHTIDADNFIERLMKQRESLFDAFHKEGQRLIIGSEDYAELMRSPEMSAHYFTFTADVGLGRRIIGLDVEVVPWIRGAVVMP
jgi:hypothetical protein